MWFSTACFYFHNKTTTSRTFKASTPQNDLQNWCHACVFILSAILCRFIWSTNAPNFFDFDMWAFGTLLLWRWSPEIEAKNSIQMDSHRSGKPNHARERIRRWWWCHLDREQFEYSNSFCASLFSAHSPRLCLSKTISTPTQTWFVELSILTIKLIVLNGWRRCLWVVSFANTLKYQWCSLLLLRRRRTKCSLCIQF